MADAAQQASGSASQGGTPKVAIPEEVQKQFPDIIDLILHSESMNDEERQYWINILPIMTPEQVQNLRDILANERQQLAAIDAKYSKEIQQIGQEQFLKQVEAERQKRRTERSSAEQSNKQKEDSDAENLLKQIQGA